MITRIEVENFKSIKHQKLEDISQIVGIWGKNGSGKSSLLQAILWCLKNGGRFSGNGLHFSNEKDFTYGHDIKNKAKANIIYKDGKYESIGGTTQNWGNDVIHSVRYFPPWRSIIQRSYSIQSQVIRDLALDHQNIHAFMHDFLHGLYDKIRRGDKDAEKLYNQMNDYATKIGFGHLFDIREGGNVTGTYTDEIMGVEIPVVDGGFGGNSFLPILLEGYSFKDGVLLIEEPEISLHPAAQAEVWDFFVEMARERNHQIIFTSHSDYLLKRIVKSYNDENFDENLVTVLKAEKTKDGTTFNKVPKENIMKLPYEKKSKTLIEELTERT